MNNVCSITRPLPHPENSHMRVPFLGWVPLDEVVEWLFLCESGTAYLATQARPNPYIFAVEFHHGSKQLTIEPIVRMSHEELANNGIIPHWLPRF